MVYTVDQVSKSRQCYSKKCTCKWFTKILLNEFLQLFNFINHFHISELVYVYKKAFQQDVVSKYNKVRHSSRKSVHNSKQFRGHIILQVKSLVGGIRPWENCNRVLLQESCIVFFFFSFFSPELGKNREDILTLPGEVDIYAKN